jgi:Domain of unknown function (DUF4189)
MTIKLFLSIAGSLFAILVCPNAAQAQYPCPGGGAGPGEVVVGRIPPSNGVGAIFLCAKTDEDQQQQPQQPPPPKPVTYTNTVQASIAWHPNATDVWAVWDVSTIDNGLNPEEFVIAACTKTMGSGCAVLGSVENGTIAIARSQIGTLRAAAGLTPKAAKAAVLADCAKAGLRCSFMKTYTAQDWFQRTTDKSRMQSYDPSLNKGGVIRKFVGAAAVSKGPKPWADKVWMSGGHTTFDAAHQAALSACQKDSKTECQMLASNAHGVIVVGIDNQNNVRAVSEQSVALAQSDVKKKCAMLKIKCTITVSFDVATLGIQSFDAFAASPKASQ